MANSAEDKEQVSLLRRTRAGVKAGLGSGKGPGRSARVFTNRRLTMTVVVTLIVAALLVIRLFYLQVIVAPALADTASELRTVPSEIEARRGDILDQNGAILATSVERYNVRVDQVEIASYRKYNDDDELIGTGAAAAAEDLHEILGMDQAVLGGILLGGEDKGRWELVIRDISPEKWREVNALGIPGIVPESYMQREYPNGYVAGNIVGYTGVTAEDDTLAGRAGIEATYNEHLTGIPGSRIVEVGPYGTVFPQAERIEIPAVDGQDVQLTIDRDLQNATQEALDSIVENSGAEWGAAVVIEIGTGRILALGDSSAPDPSNLAAVDPEDWNSRAVQAVFEPGSTGKVITLAALLDQEAITPTDIYVVPDNIEMPNGQSFKDNDNHPTATMTAAGIIGKSYNTGLIQMGDLIDDEVRYEYMVDFGLGQRTGIELPGEAAGMLYSWDMWDDRSRYTTMFGQAWAASTLQLGQMIAIIGNDGVSIPLHIVDGTYDADGIFTPTVQGESHQVISAEAAQITNQMLQGVTLRESTGIMAVVPGYNVAGKTGTAQVPDETGALNKRVGTFVGLIPAEAPQIAVSVVVFNARGAGYGGDTAAVAFSDIASFAMRTLGVAPSTEPLYKYPWFEEELDD
ncbi:MAG: penicillin-binding protein 2 [Actinomycetaceae bacterium]|nr:penicillin-binding protein 2 [Actinomycetaceae bacterium]